MVNSLGKEAKRLDVTRQAVIKFWIAERLKAAQQAVEEVVFVRLRKFLDVILPPNRLNNKFTTSFEDTTGNFRSLSATNC